MPLRGSPLNARRLPGAAGVALRLLVQTGRAWSKHNAPRIGAALAYHTAFSMAPILVIAVAVASLAFGSEAARDSVHVQMVGLLGAAGAEVVTGMLDNTRQVRTGAIATAIGIATLLLGASNLFAELQAALNLIWDAPPAPRRRLWDAIRKRFLSFSMVLIIGFLLLVSLLISAALSGAQGAFPGLAPLPLVGQAINVLISILATTVLFALIFKVLPDVPIAWREVGVGAFATAVFFAVGKLVIGLYLGNSSIASTYGAAGSFAVMLVWIYYSAQLVLFGAEFTKVYATHRATLRAAVPASVPAAVPAAVPPIDAAGRSMQP